MRANAGALHHLPHWDSETWHDIRSRVARSIEKKRIAEIALVISTLAMWGVILFSVYQTLQNFTMTGPAHF